MDMNKFRYLAPKSNNKDNGGVFDIRASGPDEQSSRTILKIALSASAAVVLIVLLRLIIH